MGWWQRHHHPWLIYAAYPFSYVYFKVLLKYKLWQNKRLWKKVRKLDNEIRSR